MAYVDDGLRADIVHFRSNGQSSLSYPVLVCASLERVFLLFKTHDERRKRRAYHLGPSWTHT